VTDWQGFWLAAIAVALVVTTIMQVTLLAVLIRIALQAARATADLRREIQPLIGKVNKIADDAARATSLAVAQVERVDQFMSHTVERVDEVFDVVHHSILTPLRQGTAILAAIKAALAVFGGRQDRKSRDDEDPLFIG
jgi:hypothetical protein